MSNVDFQWVRQQMDLAKVTVGTGVHVLALLAKWDELQVDKDHVEDVLNVFSKLAQGHALLEPSKGEVWVDVIPGQVYTGDIVRIRPDAFDGNLGTIHNGRIGKVVGVRYGDVIFRSDDGGKLIDGAHYSPYKLQRRIK